MPKILKGDKVRIVGTTIHDDNDYAECLPIGSIGSVVDILHFGVFQLYKISMDNTDTLNTPCYYYPRNAIKLINIRRK